MKNIISFMLLSSLCFGSNAMATEFYVNPLGNDAWSGTLKPPTAKAKDGPFKTLERAKQAIRTLKQTNTFNDKVNVNIATGRYYLTAPLNFNLSDSGLLGKEIVWQGDPGAQVTISAGIPITCKKRDAIFWDCPLTKLPVNTAYFDPYGDIVRGNTPKFEFYVNEQKMELARWPDQGWAHIKLPLTPKTQFSVMETLPKLPANISAAQVHIFAGNDWFDQFTGVTAVNGSANALTLTSPTTYNLESGRRFYLQNLPSLLDAPGEWIFDTVANKISFVPPTGIKPSTMMLSSLPNILVADGLNYVSFKNISFQHSAGTAVIVKNSTNIVLDHLDVNNIGGRGIGIIAGKNVQLTNSKLHHIGWAAVSVSGGDKVTLQPSGHIIHNNYIHHMSTVKMTYQPGIEINGVGIIASHNLLEQGPHNAIVMAGNDNILDKNEVHHFCLQASDCGSIYTGRDWSCRGNIIRNNYIHDIIGSELKSVDVSKNQAIYSSGGAVGVYVDDGGSGFEVSGNIFENAGSRAALQIGGGRDNKVFNNLFITNAYAIWLDDRWPTYNWNYNQSLLDASPYKSAIWQAKYPELAIPMHNRTWPEGNKIQRNIFVTTKPNGTLLHYAIAMDSTVIGDNIVWATTGNFFIDYKIEELNKNVGGAKWSDWVAQKVEQGSLVADPCITITNRQVVTCATSPATSIGFKSLPTDIGLLP